MISIRAEFMIGEMVKTTTGVQCDFMITAIQYRGKDQGLIYHAVNGINHYTFRAIELKREGRKPHPTKLTFILDTPYLPSDIVYYITDLDAQPQMVDGIRYRGEGEGLVIELSNSKVDAPCLPHEISFEKNHSLIY